MDKSKDIRIAARDALRGKWKGLILVGFILFLILYVPYMAATFLEDKLQIMVILFITGCIMVLGGPLFLGYISYVMDFLKGGERGKSALADGFRRFGKSFGIFVLFVLKLFGQCLGAFAVLGLSSYCIYHLLMLVSLSVRWPAVVSLIIFYAAFICISIFISLRYAMTFFLAVDLPDKSANWFSKYSAVMIKGYKKRLLCLQLSFLPWFLLLIALQIGIVLLSIYVFPEKISWLFFLLEILLYILPFSILYGYIVAANGIFYQQLAGIKSVENGAAELPAEKTDEICEDFPAEKKCGRAKYIVAAVLIAILSVAGLVFLIGDLRNTMEYLDSDFYEDFYEDIDDEYFDEDDLEDFIDSYEIDPADIVDSIEVSVGNISFTLSNGNGWCYFDEEGTAYNALGPEESYLESQSVEMGDAPYDYVHLSAYDGSDLTAEDLKAYVFSNYYDYEGCDLTYEDEITLLGEKAGVEVYFDESYYNGNIYFAHGEKVYHIYYVVDTEEEAEEYVDYIADTIHQS